MTNYRGEWVTLFSETVLLIQQAKNSNLIFNWNKFKETNKEF